MCLRRLFCCRRLAARAARHSGGHLGTGSGGIFRSWAALPETHSCSRQRQHHLDPSPDPFVGIKLPNGERSLLHNTKNVVIALIPFVTPSNEGGSFEPVPSLLVWGMSSLPKSSRAHRFSQFSSSKVYTHDELHAFPSPVPHLCCMPPFTLIGTPRETSPLHTPDGRPRRPYCTRPDHHGERQLALPGRHRRKPLADLGERSATTTTQSPPEP